jgi:D-glycero-D-manno-heptose 1,7-bisphosphate phosphatase
MRRAAVFLDRDGVINRALLEEQRPRPPRSVDELEVLPGVTAALTALRAAGYCLVVVTNQPDVARGTTPRSAVDAINARLQSLLPLDAVRTCMHDDADRCLCRKPAPGLINAAASELELECAASYMVGDSWRDVEAGRRAGCRTIFVYHGYAPPPDSCDFRARSLYEAAGIILGKEAS